MCSKELAAKLTNQSRLKSLLLSQRFPRIAARTRLHWVLSVMHSHVESNITNRPLASLAAVVVTLIQLHANGLKVPHGKIQSPLPTQMLLLLLLVQEHTLLLLRHLRVEANTVRVRAPHDALLVRWLARQTWPPLNLVFAWNMTAATQCNRITAMHLPIPLEVLAFHLVVQAMPATASHRMLSGIGTRTIIMLLQWPLRSSALIETLKSTPGDETS
jgi:hypothetical protein